MSPPPSRPLDGITLRLDWDSLIPLDSMTAGSASCWAVLARPASAQVSVSFTARLKVPQTSMKLETLHSETTPGRHKRLLLLHSPIEPQAHRFPTFSR